MPADADPATRSAERDESVGRRIAVVGRSAGRIPALLDASVREPLDSNGQDGPVHDDLELEAELGAWGIGSDEPTD